MALQIQYTGRNINVTPELRDFTAGKLKRIERHLDRVTSIHITFTADKLRQIAEAKVNIPGKLIHASVETENMYKTIDALIDKLIRQVTKYKEKHAAAA